MGYVDGSRRWNKVCLHVLWYLFCRLWSTFFELLTQVFLLFYVFLVETLDRMLCSCFFSPNCSIVTKMLLVGLKGLKSVILGKSQKATVFSCNLIFYFATMSQI